MSKLATTQKREVREFTLGFVPVWILSSIVSIATGMHGMRMGAIWVAQKMGLKGPSAVGTVINRKYGVQHHPMRHTMAGICTGIGNLYVMQRYITRPWLWLVTVVFGWWLGSYVPHHETTTNQGINVGAATGFISGIMQYFLLRADGVKNAGWWILANTVGTSAGYAIGFKAEYSAGLLVAASVTAVISGIITGYPLRKLLDPVVQPAD